MARMDLSGRARFARAQDLLADREPAQAPLALRNRVLEGTLEVATCGRTHFRRAADYDQYGVLFRELTARSPLVTAITRMNDDELRNTRDRLVAFAGHVLRD